MNKVPALLAGSFFAEFTARTANSFLGILLISLFLSAASPRVESADLVPVTGRVMSGDTPLCALVLANGQNMFSCSGDGSFELSVPLDSNGQVTLFSFAQGFAPYRQTLSPAEVANTTINMVREPESRALTMDYRTVESTRAGRRRVEGTVDFNATPLCALMLANGQYMFSCNENLGRFSLHVPPDSNGNITLFAFVSGFQPLKVILPAAPRLADVDLSDPLLARCAESEAAANGWSSAAEVTSLDCQKAGIKQLDGVQSLPNLETLNLRENPIDNISPLSGLGSLRELDLSSISELTVIDALFTLDALVDVDLRESGNGNIDCSDLHALSQTVEFVSRPDSCSVTNNLSASTLQVTSLDPRIGYPLDVRVSIVADEATENVSVAFVAIDKDRSNIRELPLGTPTIERVEAGTGSYELALDIPASVEVPGPYFIGAIIDPVNVIAETDEEDNRALTEVTLEPLESPQHQADKEPVNIFIERVELDSSVLSLDTTEYERTSLGAQNADAGGTLVLGAQGADKPIAVEAFAYLRLTRSDQGGQPPDPGITLFSHSDPGPGSHAVPLYLWNSEAERYMYAYGVDSQGNPAAEEWLPIGQLEPQLIVQAAEDVTFNGLDRRAVHLDFYFPGRLARELEVAVRHLNVFLSDPQFPPPDLSTEEIQALSSFLRNLPISSDPDNPYDEGPALEVLSAAICVEIRPADSSAVEDRFTEDNEICSAVTFDLPPLPPPRPVPVSPPPEFTPIHSEPSREVFFNKNYRDDWGGRYFGVGVDFNAFSQVDIDGFVAQASGKVPVRLFGVGVNFMDARGTLLLLPEVAGAPTDRASGLELVLSFADQQIFNRFEPMPEVAFSGELIPPPVFSQEKRVTRTFHPGGVPVTVEGFVTGRIGSAYTLDVQAGPLKTSLGATADTFARLDAGATALVGIGGFLAIGAEGDLLLLRESYRVSTGSELSVVRDGFAADGIVDVEFTPRLDIVNDVTGAAGTVLVYAEFPVPAGVKFCGYFKIPCGLRFRQARENLVLDRFVGYRRVDPLLSVGTTIEVVRLADGSVAYYSPKP